MRAFLIAVQFLTRLPIRLGEAPAPSDLGGSVPYFPLVGLLIGALLAGLAARLMPHVSHLLGAGLLLAVWVFATGGLHLDGLGDSADAWVGGQGSRTKTLAIMKDPFCGPAAVVTLVTVLLVKFAALTTLASAGDWTRLALAPLLGRATLPLLFLTTPYVRPGGLGAPMSTHLPRRATMISLLVTAAVVILVSGTRGIGLIVVALGVFALLRGLMMHRIGGTTGDTAGALVELVETAVTVIGAIKYS